MAKYLLTVLLLLPQISFAGGKPVLWGHGIKACEDYLAAYQGWEDGHEEQIDEYLRFQDWLTGFMSGLSLATGEDVLSGVELEGVMRRIQLHCDEHPADDFFSASVSLIRLLNTIKAIQ